MKLRKHCLKKSLYLTYVPFFVFLIISFSQVSLAEVTKNDCEVDIKFKFGTEGLSVNFSDRSKEGYHQILWDFGDGTVLRGAEATHTYEKGGKYICAITVSTKKGCEKRMEIPVYIFDVEEKKSPTIKSDELRLNYQTYPNPVQNDIFITYELNKGSHIMLTLSNLDDRGASDWILQNEPVTSGKHQMKKSLLDMPKGRYVMKLWADHAPVLSHQIIMH